MQAKYYYEIHVTVRAPEDKEQKDVLEELSQRYGFHTSTFLMYKKNLQPEAFTSKRGNDLIQVTRDMKALVSDLRIAGLTVLRYKIEDTLVDSHKEDIYNLI